MELTTKTFLVGTVRMPDYHGDTETKLHVVSADWEVSGVLDDGRTFTVRVSAGFSFDGCSIPRALWRVCGHPMEIPRVAAALAHDWLYAAKLCSRKTADAIYAAICKAVDMGSIRVWTEHKALRLFGGAAWNSHGADDQAFARSHGALLINGKMRGDNDFAASAAEPGAEV